MAKAPARQKFMSPKGTFKFPKLIEPDTKFKEEGEYSVKLICDKSDPAVQKLIALADREAAASLERARGEAKTPAIAKKWETKYLPYADVEDEETGDPTGEVEIKFTMKASGVSKKTGKPWSRKPTLFDAKGKVMKNPPEIGGGTIGKISYEIIPYAPTTQVGASVKFALEAVQIIELVEKGEGGNRSASSYGFGEEEGYAHDDTKPAPEKDDEDENEGGFGDETSDEIGDEEIPF